METWFIPLFLQYKKLKLTSKGLSVSCNYTLARVSNKSKMVVYSEQKSRKKTSDPLQRIQANFSVPRIPRQTSLSLILQTGAKLRYNLGRGKNGLLFSLNINSNKPGRKVSPFGRCLYGILSHRGSDTDQRWECESLAEESMRIPPLKWLSTYMRRQEVNYQLGKMLTKLNWIYLLEKILNTNNKNNEWVYKSSKLKLNNIKLHVAL